MPGWCFLHQVHTTPVVAPVPHCRVDTHAWSWVLLSCELASDCVLLPVVVKGCIVLLSPWVQSHSGLKAVHVPTGGVHNQDKSWSGSMMYYKGPLRRTCMCVHLSAECCVNLCSRLHVNTAVCDLKTWFKALTAMQRASQLNFCVSTCSLEHPGCPFISKAHQQVTPSSQDCRYH